MVLPEMAQFHQQWQHKDIAQSTDGAQVSGDVANFGVEDGEEDKEDHEGSV